MLYKNSVHKTWQAPTPVKAPGKDGKGGYDFWGCSGWPECKQTEPA